MPRSTSTSLFTAAAAMLLTGCDQIELFGLYIANHGTEAVVKAPLPLELPFEDHDGWIVVQARVNGGKPVGLMLDTGAPLMALLQSDSTKHLQLDMSGAHRFGASDNLAAPIGARQNGLDITIGGLSLKNQTVLALSASGLKCVTANQPAFPFGGVIGHDILRRFVVEVNRDSRVIRLHDPEAYRYGGRGRIVPISFEGRQPFVEALITPRGGPTYSARLQIDTGTRVEATLVPGSSPDIVAPAAGELSSSCFVGGEATYRSGPPIDIRLGDQRVSSAVGYATGREAAALGQNGRLGARFLARFNLVFDYGHERLILEPRATSTPTANGTGAAERANSLRHNAS